MAVRSHWLFLLKSSLASIELQIADIRPYDIDNIDPYEAEEIRPNVWRAPKLDVDTAVKKYGKETHH